MENMKWKLACIVMVCGFVGLCTADTTRDFNISGSRISILHLTDEAKTAIEALSDKKDKTVVVEKKCSQDDFSVICQLGWIRKLEFQNGNEKIHDLSPLVQLKNLQKLKVTSAKASKETPFDVAPLGQLTALVEVDFYATRITNTQAMSALKNLRKVSFYMSDVDSIDFLSGTPEIRELNLYGANHTFEDYKPLLGLKKLRTLDIYVNPQATDELLAPLAALTSLQEIRMSSCRKVTTLDFLKNCREMRTIHAMWCKNLTDISALTKMDLLEWVSISDCKVSDISVLKSKKHLAALEISKTAVSDITPLDGCTLLQKLKLEKTQVEDLSVLSRCHNLQQLNIKDTSVNDISVLLNCDDLRRLEVGGTVPQKQIDKLKDIFPDLQVIHK